jgi:hypothetical protein
MNSPSAAAPVTQVSPNELAEKLPETLFSGRYDETLDPSKNLLWCSTFQLCWDSLGRDVLGGDPELEKAPALATSLNRHLTRGADLDEGSYLAMAGFGKDGILERIRNALLDRFSGKANPDLLPDAVGPDDILAYAYLLKNLLFGEPFHNLGAKPFVAPERPNLLPRVEAFGLEPSLYSEETNQEQLERIRQQVKIHHYQDLNDFVIELESKSQGDRLLLARLQPKKTLAETAEEVVDRVEHGTCPQPELGPEELLIVPKMDFDVTRDFPEIEGRRLLNRGFEDIFFAKALQNVRFKLNERGAVLESEAMMFLAAGAPEVLLREFNLCAPHLLLMMRKGARAPYFAFWVGNDELLVPTKGTGTFIE